MIDPTGTELVFADLNRAYKEMMVSRRYPSRFRRSFDEYLYRSQQLTEVMRKEFLRATGKAWIASEFPGWNMYSAAVKAIRNAVVHGTPLVLHEVIISIYPAVPFGFWGKEIGPRQTAAGVRIITGTCFVGAPFRDEITTPNIGFPSLDGQTHIFPLKEFVSYELPWPMFDTETNSIVSKTGTTDVIRLVLGSYPILCQYFCYYQLMLKSLSEKSLNEAQITY